MTIRNALPALGLLLAVMTGAAAPARAADPMPVDRIAAIVNDEPILQSEVEEQLAILVASRQLDPSDSSMVARARQQVLEQLIEERVILDYARKQGISVTDDQIAPQVEAAMAEVKERIGSEEKFQSELARQGMTVEQLRERYRTDLRKEAMAQRIIDREIRSKVKITDSDVDTFFVNNKDQLPIKPTVYTLAHILVIPKPDASRRAAARARALKAQTRLTAGDPWDAVCREMSEDPNAAKTLGDLGEANEGDFDPAFEAAVRDLEPGQRSGIVESAAGYHIIELIARDGTRYHARHIMILAQPSPDDVGAAIERAKKAHDAAIKGTEEWAILVNSYSDDAGTRLSAGNLGEVPASSLGRQYVEALDSLKIGGVSEVLQGPTGFHIFKLLGKTEGGAYKLEDIRPQLTNMLTQKKLAEEYDRWIADVRKKSFVEIKTP